MVVRITVIGDQSSVSSFISHIIFKTSDVLFNKTLHSQFQEGRGFLKPTQEQIYLNGALHPGQNIWKIVADFFCFFYIQTQHLGKVF